MSLRDLLTARRSHREYTAAPLRDTDLAALAWAAQGGTADGRRTVPSAHALYPLSVTALATRVDGLSAGIHRWHPDTARFSLVAKGNVADDVAAAAIDEQPWLAQAPALLVLGGDLAAATAEFAEQPPRGARGARYLWLEAGTAAQNVYLAATEAGLGTVLVAGFRDDALAAVHPELLPSGHIPLVVMPIGHPR